MLHALMMEESDTMTNKQKQSASVGCFYHIGNYLIFQVCDKFAEMFDLLTQYAIMSICETSIIFCTGKGT